MANRVWSPIARKVPRPRDVKNRTKPYGIMVHCTGSSIVEEAKKHNTDPLEYAAAYYSTPGHNFPNYLIGWDNGDIWQIAADTEISWHCAWADWEIKAYREGNWRNFIEANLQPTAAGAETYKAWDDVWKPLGYNSPARIPSIISNNAARTPNNAYVGIELLSKTPYPEAQYDSLAKLIIDLCLRWSIPVTDQHLPAIRLPSIYILGHQDMSPCRRWLRSGKGWDPGPLDWDKLSMWTAKRTNLTGWYDQLISAPNG